MFNSLSVGDFFWFIVVMVLAYVYIKKFVESDAFK